MFLNLAHQQLEVFKRCKELVDKTYAVVTAFPPEEKYGLTNQTKRAVMSVLLNLAEGCSRASARERRRFLEIARGSLIEVDTALEIAVQLKFVQAAAIDPICDPMVQSMKMISKMITQCSNN